MTVRKSSLEFSTTNEALQSQAEEAENYIASVARQRVAAEGPGEDSAGGVAFRPGVVGQAPKAAEALEWTLPRSVYGYDRGTTQVFGGVTRTQWLMTLTGESPTSSAPTPVAGPVRPTDKATPKRSEEAAERRRPTRTMADWGWQLFRCSDDGRDRKTQRKDDPS